MSEQEHVELQLDTITQVTRFIVRVPPLVANRVSLGVALAIDDAANDPAGELLGAKIAQGTAALMSVIRHVAKASAEKAGLVASSVHRTVSAGIDQGTTPQARAARSATVDRIPGVRGITDSISKAASEAHEKWQTARTITVDVVAEDPQLPVDSDHLDTISGQSDHSASAPSIVPTV